MATTEELVVHARLRDDLSRGLHAVDAQVQRTARRVRSLGAAANTALGSRSRGFLGLSTSTKTLGDRLGGLSRSIRNVGADLRRHIVAGGRAAALVIATIGAAAGAMGVKIASDFQIAEVALRRLTGSAEAGADVFKFLTELDPLRPFDIAQLQQSAVMLGQVISDTETLKATIAGVSDVAALNPAALEPATRAIAQMLDAGTIYAQDLNQLIQAGVPGVGRAVRDAYGMSVAELRRANERGMTVAAQPFLDALFAGAAGTGEEIATQTFRGLLSGMKTRAMLRLNEAFRPLLTVLQGILPGLEAGFGDFVANIAPPLSNLLALLAPLIGDVLRSAGPVLGAIFTGLGRLLAAAAPAFDLLAPVVDELVLAIGELVTNLVPVMPDLVEGFVALVGLLPDFVRFLAMLVPLVAPLVDLLTTLLDFAPTRAILLGIAMAVLAFGPIASIVSGVWTFVGAIYGLAAAYTALRTAQVGAGGPLGVPPVGGMPGAPMGGGAGGVLRGVGAGVAGIGGTLGLYGAVSSAQSKGGASVGDVIGGAASGALVGGAIGSVVPGVGTGIGAAAGGIIGGAGTFVSGLFGRKKKPTPATPTVAAAPVDASLTMAPGAVVIDARGMTPEQLARAIPTEIEHYQRDRAERGPRGARS